MTTLIPFSAAVHTRLIWEWGHEDLRANASDAGYPTTYAEHEAQLATRARDRHLMWCLDVDGTLVGFLVADLNTHGAGITDVHICITRSRHRQGIATAAFALMCAHLRPLGQHTLVAYVFADNVAMCRFLDHLGGQLQSCAFTVQRDGVEVPVTTWCLPIGSE